jgi:predicted transcriptional regulator
MNRFEEFLDYFDYLVENCKHPVEIPESVQETYQMIKSQSESSEKVEITELGAQILAYLQTADSVGLKAKDIAEGLEISSRKVTGAIRKLVTDGYVDKFGQNPVTYLINEKGKNYDLKEYSNG